MSEELTEDNIAVMKGRETELVTRLANQLGSLQAVADLQELLLPDILNVRKSLSGQVTAHGVHTNTDKGLPFDHIGMDYVATERAIQLVAGPLKKIRKVLEPAVEKDTKKKLRK